MEHSYRLSYMKYISTFIGLDYKYVYSFLINNYAMQLHKVHYSLGQKI